MNLPDDTIVRLDAGLDALGLAGRPALRVGLLAYIALLERWNRTYNLTAVRDPAQMVTLHLLDSLAIHPWVAEFGALVDIGSGGGLPGIPLALLRPQLQVTLVESAGKKARFLREAQRTLGLGNARVFEGRAEAAPGSGDYDCLTARAFGTLAAILAVGGHLLKPGGRLLALKGKRPADELASLPAGYRIAVEHVLQVPGLDAQRHLIVIEKTPSA